MNILSSVSESFPNVLVEAMACGIPCITTDVGDAAFILNNLGWVVQPADPISLANAITKALSEKYNEPNDWESRRISCRERIVENFKMEKMVNDFNKVWQEVAAEKMSPKWKNAK